jgi:hypothetical protein
VTRRWAPLLVLAAGGCAYFNGIYNSKSAARVADRQFRRGEEYAAADSYRASAFRAETVLARHPRTRWRADAIYLAARGFALAGAATSSQADCRRAAGRIEQFLAIPNTSPEQRERVLIAHAACLWWSRQLYAADTILTPLLTSEHEDVRLAASLWGGRVALATGDADKAARLLARVPGGAATWEFMTAAFDKGDFALAESLLIARADVGDWRSEVPRRVRDLWSAGRRDGVVQVVDNYGRSGAPVTNRVTLHFQLSDLAAVAGDTALARRQAEEAGRVGVTSFVEAEVRARLLALRIRELDAIGDIYAVVTRDSVRAREAPLFRRIQDNLLLMRLALARPTDNGSHVFVAAEIVRDSLGAKRLAYLMFRSIERDFPEWQIAGRALLAAAAIVPESAQAFHARIAERWPDSYAAVWLRRGPVGDSSTVRPEDTELLNAWRFAALQFADTLKARRIADSVAAANAARGTPPP